MSALILRTPFARPTAAAAPRTFIRHESSARRQTKALRLHPHPSMKILTGAPTSDHIIYNPPSAAPNPLITPSIFLPPSDPRRTLLATPQTTPTKLPPPMEKVQEPSYHLGLTEFKEIRMLRKMDPVKYTRVYLAKMFDTSPTFIGMVAQSTKEHREKMAKELEKVKERWGTKRMLAREERAKRKAGWGGRDGL